MLENLGYTIRNARVCEFTVACHHLQPSLDNVRWSGKGRS
jgi:hypothetical protein